MFDHSLVDDSRQSPLRILPGDEAPSLSLSYILHRGAIPFPTLVSPPEKEPNQLVTFDRLSIVILWNAGCGGCLPVIEELSEFAAEHNVPCYGVAVMVRDSEATAAIASSRALKAFLAIEERPLLSSSALWRGLVTRHWLEASGQAGVPAGFIIDGSGTIAWMGDPADIKSVLSRLFVDDWDITAARKEWSSRVSDVDIQNLRIVGDLTELLVAGKIAVAKEFIDLAEKQWSAVTLDKDFNLLKFDVLILEPGFETSALEQYAKCIEVFPDRLDVQLRLATRVLARMPSNEIALGMAIDRLKTCEKALSEAAHPAEQKDLGERVFVSLTLAEALLHAGLPGEALPRIENAAILSQDWRFSKSDIAWVEAEIDRLRKSA